MSDYFKMTGHTNDGHPRSPAAQSAAAAPHALRADMALARVIDMALVATAEDVDAFLSLPVDELCALRSAAETIGCSPIDAYMLRLRLHKARAAHRIATETGAIDNAFHDDYPAGAESRSTDVYLKHAAAHIGIPFAEAQRCWRERDPEVVEVRDKVKGTVFGKAYLERRRASETP